jgi:transmembrane sensor
MSESRSTLEQETIDTEAAEWLLRLRQPRLTLEDTLAWQQWLAQDPRHERAFRVLEELWDRFGSIPTPAPVPSEALRADTYDGSVSVSAWQTQPRAHEMRSPRRWALAAMFLIALSCIIGGSVLTHSMLGHLPRDRTFETAIGQNASVTLADGSTIQMGGDTRLIVVLRPQFRQIDLLQGEACFQVAKDRARPFRVRAGAATVTAVGTEFNVRRSDDRVVVSVLEGRVLVQPMAALIPISWISASRTRGPAAPVAAGQKSTVDGRGVESTQTISDGSSAVSWEHGRMAFEAEPLRYVVQDVNRYAQRPIVIADARLGDLRITGTVTEANVIGWIRSLEAAFDIHADIQPDKIILRAD